VVNIPHNYNSKGSFLMEYTQEFSPGNENDTEVEVAVATVATLSQNTFEAPRNEGNISHSNWTSNTTSSGYETFTEELEEHALAAGFDQHLAPDDVENQSQMQARTQNKPPLYPAPEGQSFLTSVEVPKLDPTPGLPSPSPHLPGFHGSPIPIFHLADLAYTKLIIHALKHAPKTVNGVLLGRISVSDASISIVDAVPLQHHWLLDISSYTDVGLIVVGSTLPYPLLYYCN
jgi:hypothetical protein